jgi:hypothetical protein
MICYTNGHQGRRMIPTIKDTPYLGEFECHYRKTAPDGSEITGDATGVIARDSSGRSVQQYDSNSLGDLVPHATFA